MAIETFEGSITLVTVEDGAPGSPGAPGESTYTFIRYSANADGSNMTEEPNDSTKYIGIVVVNINKAPEDNKQYTWSKFVGQDGKDGVADTYFIEVDYDKIYKFVEQDGNISFSPESISFNVYKTNSENKQTEQIEFNNFLINTIKVVFDEEDYGDYKELLENLENFLSELYTNVQQEENNEVIELVSLLDQLKKSVNNKTIVFNFSSLTKLLIDELIINKDNAELENQYREAFKILQQNLLNKNFAFIIEINETDENNNLKKLATSSIICEFGTNENMAKFALTAANITAAIENTGMIFNREGLTIKNGGFKIIKEDDTINAEEIFGYDNASKTLRVVGSGSFSGNIAATSGDIGGFIITQDALYDKRTYREYTQTIDTEINSNKTYYVLDESGNYIIFSGTEFEEGKIYYEFSPSSDIQLLGNQGLIKANNIELGAGAKIKDYIALGNFNEQQGQYPAYIYNPSSENNNGIFLKAGNSIILNARDEEIKIGNITLNGKESKIFGANFSITPDWSNFSNVNVSGKISTSIFEKGHTQVVGGAMLFKAAYRILKIENENIILEIDDLEENTFFSNGEHPDIYFCLIQSDGMPTDPIKGYSFNSKEKKLTILNYSDDLLQGTYNSLVILGENDSIIIGINSEDNENSFLKARGLTISQINENGIVSNRPRSFLGDLNRLGIDNVSGYGLYSDNVYLTGSLTTEIEANNSYAGINTLDGVNATKFGTSINDDTSKIVFWAGSNGVTPGAIQSAKFQVTQNGSIYGSQGYFEDSVIARSKITGADIYAARLHGVELDAEGIPTEDIGALTIYDTNKGIIFKSGFNTTEEKETFSIGMNGFKINDNYFIKINETEGKKEATFSGKGIFSNLEMESITIQPKKSNQRTEMSALNGFSLINYFKNNETDISTELERLEIKDLSLGFYLNGNKSESKMFLDSSNFNINVNKVNFVQDLKLGTNEYMEYQKVEKGYDLYVYSELKEE